MQEPIPVTDPMIIQSLDGEEDPVLSEKLPHANFTLFVTVFDHEVTEIRFAPVKDGITVVSNIAFTYLPAIKTIDGDGTKYSFFSFFEHVSDDTKTTRGRPDPTLFSSTAPEYIIYAEGDAPLPEGLSDAVDALHGHYLKHQADFAAKAERAKILQAARQRAEKPEPQETVINFYPIRSNVHRSQSN